MASLKHIRFFPPRKNGSQFASDLEPILGFKPQVLSIYEKAFTHRSVGAVNTLGQPRNYERLEFLGDAMLGAVIAAYLFIEVPTGDEGYLTKMRSKVVSREHLNELGRDLNLVRFVKTTLPAKQFSENIHGNVFEALIGAIYLDRGFAHCERFIYKRVIEPYVDIEKLEGKVISYKSLFIEWCQKNKKQFKFDIFEDTGKNEVKHFGVRLFLDAQVVAKGRATSKKKAEEQAAKRAYYKFQERIDKFQTN